MSPQDGFLLQDKVVPRLPEAGQSRGNATSNPSATGCCTGTSSFGCTDFANKRQARLSNHRQNEIRQMDGAVGCSRPPESQEDSAGGAERKIAGRFLPCMPEAPQRGRFHPQRSCKPGRAPSIPGETAPHSLGPGPDRGCAPALGLRAPGADRQLKKDGVNLTQQELAPRFAARLRSPQRLASIW